MSRSSWKVPYISSNFFHNKFLHKEVFTTHIRYSLIPYTFINKRISVYNGRYLKSIIVLPEMLGHKLGEFSFSKNSIAQRKGKEKRNMKKKK